MVKSATCYVGLILNNTSLSLNSFSIWSQTLMCLSSRRRGNKFHIQMVRNGPKVRIVSTDNVLYSILVVGDPGFLKYSSVTFHQSHLHFGLIRGGYVEANSN